MILTTGGTGPSRRDVTPEATLAVATRTLPGFGEQMRAVSLAFVPTAILSRQVGVLREIKDHAALIINLPGSPRLSLKLWKAFLPKAFTVFLRQYPTVLI